MLIDFPFCRNVLRISSVEAQAWSERLIHVHAHDVVSEGWRMKKDASGKHNNLREAQVEEKVYRKIGFRITMGWLRSLLFQGGSETRIRWQIYMIAESCFQARERASEEIRKVRVGERKRQQWTITLFPNKKHKLREYENLVVVSCACRS